MPNRTRSGSDTVRRPPTARKLFGLMHLPGQLRVVFAFLLHARNKQFFFAVVANIHPIGSAGYLLIELAYETICNELRGRYRRSGELESEHAIRCALILMIFVKETDPDRIAAMLLHDLAETFRSVPWVDKIARMFNINVAVMVFWLTKPAQGGELRTDEDVDQAYYPQLAKAPWIIICLKGIDRFDNLITYWREMPSTRQQKAAETTRTIYKLMVRRSVKLAPEMKVVIKYLLHLE